MQPGAKIEENAKTIITMAEAIDPFEMLELNSLQEVLENLDSKTHP